MFEIQSVSFLCSCSYNLLFEITLQKKIVRISKYGEVVQTESLDCLVCGQAHYHEVKEISLQIANKYSSTLYSKNI